MHKQKTDVDSIRLKATKICPSCNRQFEAESEHSVCPDDETRLTPVLVDTDIGMVVGKYRLVSKIADGSSAQVFYAKHIETCEKAAVKLLNLNLLSDPVAVKNFQNQIDAISSLDHQNIAGIKDFGILSNGHPYIVMEFVESRTLAELLATQGALEHALAVRIFFSIADALVAAHKVGIFHRDIKPSNIMFDEKSGVKVLDFGIAKIIGVETSSTLTRTGVCVGTPAYMSPEQCFGGTVDARSDIYSLGCLMYECLSNSHVFPSDNAFNCMNKHAFEKPRTLKKLIGSIPPWLNWIVMTCLQKNPDRRIQSMEMLKSALQACSTGGFESWCASKKLQCEMALRGFGKSDKIVDGGASDTSASNHIPQRAAAFAIFVALVAIFSTTILPMIQPANVSSPAPPSAVPVRSDPGDLFGKVEENFENEDSIKLLEQQFSDIEKEISRLRAENQSAKADEMTERLQVFRDIYAGNLALAGHRGAEVDSLSVSKGFGGITSFSDKNDLPGHVAVKITYNVKPVILNLCTERPVTWNIKKGPGVKLEKVYLNGRVAQTVDGLDGKTEIVTGGGDDNKNMQVGVPWISDEHKKLAEIARTEMNGELISLLSIQHPRDAIVIGPENKFWLAQFVLTNMREFYESCMARDKQSILSDVRKIKFDGIWHAGDFFEPAVSIGSFTPFGPEKSTMTLVKGEDLLDATSVTDKNGVKTWYLLASGRGDNNGGILKFDPRTKALTKLPSPNPLDPLPWWSFKSISYDEIHNQFLMLVQQEGPVRIFDIKTGKWLDYKCSLPYGQELFGVTYCKDDDAYYAVGTNLLEHPYRAYLYKIVDGKVVKKLKLSESPLHGSDAGQTVKLYSVGKYLVGVFTNIEHSAPSDPHATPGPKCAVFERDTGRVLYSGVMTLPAK